MALKTRLRVLGLVKGGFIAGLLIIAFITLFAYQTASAANISQDQISTVNFMWQVITGLLALLQTIFIGIGVWLISNQTELFRRVGGLEVSVEARKVVCEERHE